MPKETANHKLKKPLYSDNADIAVINENFDAIDELLTPSVYAATAPDSVAVKGKLSAVLGWLANRIKAITGQNSWQASPPVSLTECSNATSDYTASKLMMRDSSGRARVQSPSTSYDIANKTYVDSNFVKKNADTTMTAKLTAYSNTSYTTKQVRNIVLWTSGSTPPATSYGDIVIKTF